MFSNVTFNLERLIGGPTDPAAFELLLDTQSHIRTWMMIHDYNNPICEPEWCPPPIDTLYVGITQDFDSPDEIGFPMPIGDAAFRWGITDIIIRGMILMSTLSFFPSLRNLSISRYQETGLTHIQMLTSIITILPKLQDLVFWTNNDDLMGDYFQEVSSL